MQTLATHTAEPNWLRRLRKRRQLYISLLYFFFNDTAPTEIYTLSLHDALPISAIMPRMTDHRSDGQFSFLFFDELASVAHEFRLWFGPEMNPCFIAIRNVVRIFFEM